jgi:hypothetical protein
LADGVACAIHSSGKIHPPVSHEVNRRASPYHAPEQKSAEAHEISSFGWWDDTSLAFAENEPVFARN